MAAQLLERSGGVVQVLEALEQHDRVEVVGERASEPFVGVPALERDALPAEVCPSPLDRCLVVVDPGDRGRRAGEDPRPVAAAAAEVEHPHAGAELGHDLVAMNVGDGEQRLPAGLLEAQALDGVHDTSASLACARSSPIRRSYPGRATARSIEPTRTR